MNRQYGNVGGSSAQFRDLYGSFTQGLSEEQLAKLVISATRTYVDAEEERDRERQRQEREEAIEARMQAMEAEHLQAAWQARLQREQEAEEAKQRQLEAARVAERKQEEAAREARHRKAEAERQERKERIGCSLVALFLVGFSIFCKVSGFPLPLALLVGCILSVKLFERLTGSSD